jgi:hypothetical protein
MAKGGPTKKRTGAQRRKRALRLVGVASLCLIGVLYYRPVRTYMETRAQLDERAGEVRALERERDQLERRLAASADSVTLVRDARRLGLVRPGERLVIVKNIAEWRRAHEPSEP